MTTNEEQKTMTTSTLLFFSSFSNMKLSKCSKQLIFLIIASFFSLNEASARSEIILAKHDKMLPMGALRIENRLAFMTGHVEVGLELYRLGELQMAAKHLLHPISETHKEERVGLEKLGLKKHVFEQVSESLRQNVAATKISKLLDEAASNLNDLAAKVDGESDRIIVFLLETVLDEYSIAVSEERKILELGEYQDAWGFIKVARSHASKVTIEDKDSLKSQLKDLHLLWKNGPLHSENVASVKIVKSKIDSILKIIDSR